MLVEACPEHEWEQLQGPPRRDRCPTRRPQHTCGLGWSHETALKPHSVLSGSFHPSCGVTAPAQSPPHPPGRQCGPGAMSAAARLCVRHGGHQGLHWVWRACRERTAGVTAAPATRPTLLAVPASPPASLGHPGLQAQGFRHRLPGHVLQAQQASRWGWGQAVPSRTHHHSLLSLLGFPLPRAWPPVFCPPCFGRMSPDGL